jgi:hypothetical protein
MYKFYIYLTNAQNMEHKKYLHLLRRPEEIRFTQISIKIAYMMKCKTHFSVVNYVQCNPKFCLRLSTTTVINSYMARSGFIYKVIIPFM